MMSVVAALSLATAACGGSSPCRGDDYMGPSVSVDASNIQKRWPAADVTVCADSDCHEYKLIPTDPPDQALPAALKQPPVAPRVVSLRIVVDGKTVADSRIDHGLQLHHARCGPPDVPLSTDRDGRLVKP